MKKGMRICGIILFVAICAAIWADIRWGHTLSSEVLTASDSVDSELIETPYHKDGIEAVYPRFVSGGTKEQLERWNQLIYKDFDRILQIYSFNPFPEPAPSPQTSMPVLLRIGYTVKQNSERYLSILYTAAYNSPYSAHPTDLVYTTNIDKEEDRKIRLRDYVKLNLDFVKNFRTWNFIPVEEDNEELNQAIRDYISQMSDQDLLLGFQEADVIGSDNLYGIFSYMTVDRLGISLSVPNYIGDHVEFEADKKNLQEYIR